MPVCPHEPYVLLFLSDFCYSEEWGLQDERIGCVNKMQSTGITACNGPQEEQLSFYSFTSSQTFSVIPKSIASFLKEEDSERWDYQIPAGALWIPGLLQTKVPHFSNASILMTNILVLILIWPQWTDHLPQSEMSGFPCNTFWSM